MNLITLKKSIESEKIFLNKIFDEAKSYFNQVEGREPLPPLININGVIPDLPQEACHCLSVYYLTKIIGYLWVFDDSPSSFYVLHFYISEGYRNLGFASLAVDELEKSYDICQLKTAELVVSASNYLGMRFWTSNGFNKILYVYEPSQIGSSSIELELS